MENHEQTPERWARYWARRYAWALEGRPWLDMDDLASAAMLGILAAQATYEPDRGSWATYSAYFIRKEVRALLGIRDGSMPPCTLSLDDPITNEDGESAGTHLDQLPDNTLPDADAGPILDDLKRDVRAAVDDLPERQRTVVQRWQLEGGTQAQAAAVLGITPQRAQQLWIRARRTLARDKRLRQYADIEERTPYFVKVGPERFASTHTSAVEHAVLWRLRHQAGRLDTRRATQ